MNDPIERYYDQFETRMESAMRRTAAPSRRRVWRVAIAGAVAGLALGVGVAVLPGSDGEGSTAYAVAKAKAALSTDDAIIHIVTVGKIMIDDKPSVARAELWTGPDRMRFAFDGEEGTVRWYPYEDSTDGKMRVRSDSYDPETNTLTYSWTRMDRSSPLFEKDPTADVRRKLATGKWTDEGTVTVNGRRARKFVSRSEPTPAIQTGPNSGIASTDGSVEEYYVDPDTFAPIRLSLYGDSAGDELITVTDFKKFERLPLNAQNRELLRLNVPADAKRKDATEEVALLKQR